MGRLGGSGRREAEHGLARRVEPVLEAAERADRLVLVEQLGVAAIASSRASVCEARSRARRPGSRSAPRLSFGRHGAHLARRSIEYHRRAVDALAASILVVEDDAALRMVCRVNLELDGFRVREAATGRRGARAVAASGPALVFLDLHLGTGASDELLDELRAEGIPVVLVSGTVDVTEYEGRATRRDAEAVRPADLVGWRGGTRPVG